jgi:outer membrane protein assembly factor BamB
MRGHYGTPGGPPWQAGPPNLPPNTPPGKQGGSRRTAILIVVVVALVVGAGGFWFLTKGGSDDAPNTPASKDYDAAAESIGVAEVAWRVDQGDAPEAIGVEDFWVTDEQLVRRLPGRVTAYDLKSGEEAWTFSLEGELKDYCASSQEHSNNRVALLVSTGDDGRECGKLVVLDIATGKEVCTTELGNGKTEQPPTAAALVAVFGERVLIGGDAGRVLDITSGAPASVPSALSACDAVAFAVFGEQLLVESECASADKTGSSTRLRAFDANLALAWEWATPKDEEEGGTMPVLGVISVEPLVVELGYAGRPSQLMRVDPKSGQAVRIKDYDATTGDPEFMKACDDHSLVSCDTARVVDNKLIITTTLDQINPGTPDAAPGQQSTEFRNELVAFDLDSGEEAWRTGQEGGRLLSMVRADEKSGLVAYRPENPNGAKGMLFTVDPGSGKLTPLLPLGPKAHENVAVRDHRREANFGGDNHRGIYRDGLFVIFSVTHREESKDSVDAVAFSLEGGS